MFHSILAFFLLISACAIVVVFYFNIREVIDEGKKRFNDDAVIDGVLSKFQTRVRADMNESLQRVRRDLTTPLNENNDRRIDKHDDAMRKLVNTDLTPQLHVIGKQLDDANMAMSALSNTSTRLETDFQKFTEKLHDEMSSLKSSVTDKLLNRLDDVKSQLLEPNNELSSSLDIIKTHILEPNTDMLKNLQLLKTKLDVLQKNPNVELMTTLTELKDKVTSASGVSEQLNALREMNRVDFIKIQEKLATMEDDWTKLANNHEAKRTEGTLKLESGVGKLSARSEEQFKHTIERLDKLYGDLVDEQNRVIIELRGLLESQSTRLDNDRLKGESSAKLLTASVADGLVVLGKDISAKHRELRDLVDETRADIVTRHSAQNLKLGDLVTNTLSTHEALATKIDDMLGKIDEISQGHATTGLMLDDKTRVDGGNATVEHERIMSSLSKVRDTLSLLPESLEKKFMANEKLLTADNVGVKIVVPIVDKLGASIEKISIDEPLANRLFVEPLRRTINETALNPIVAKQNDLFDRLQETQKAQHLEWSNDKTKISSKLDSNGATLTKLNDKITDLTKTSESMLEKLNGDALSKSVSEHVNEINRTNIYEPLNKSITSLPKTLNVDFDPLITDLKTKVVQPLNGELYDKLTDTMNTDVKKPIIKMLDGDAIARHVGDNVIGRVTGAVWSDPKLIDEKLLTPLGASIKTTITAPLMSELDGPMRKRLKSVVTDVLVRELDEPLVKRLKTTVSPMIAGVSTSVTHSLDAPLNKVRDDMLTTMKTQSDKIIKDIDGKIIRQTETTKKEFNTQSSRINVLLQRIDEFSKHTQLPDWVKQAFDDIRASQTKTCKSTEIERLAFSLKQLQEYQTLLSEDHQKRINALDHTSALESLTAKTDRISELVESNATRVVRETGELAKQLNNSITELLLEAKPKKKPKNAHVAISG